MSCIVLLDLQVKPEAVGEMKALLRSILPDTRAYDGCRGLDVYGNLDDTGNLVFHEQWASRAHYDRYLAWRIETGVAAQLGALLAGPLNARFCERVEA